MKRDRWQFLLIVCLTVCSSALLTACASRDEVRETVHRWQIWLKEHNHFDPSKLNKKFIGTGFKYDEEFFAFAEPETLVALAFPEERTECTDDPKSIANLPLRYVLPEFRKCVAELAQQTQVPILLPAKYSRKLSEEYLFYTYIREKSPHEDSQYTSASRSIKAKDSQRYVIGITHRPGNYYTALVGYITGKKITSNTPTLEAIKRAWDTKGGWVKSHHHSQAVVLMNGISAYYFPPVCGVNCQAAYGRVVWEQNGYQYKIGVRMGRREHVVELANSAIANQL